MFLVQRLKEEYEEQMQCQIGFEELNALGDGYAGVAPLFDVNSSRFFHPACMAEEIWQYFIRTGQMSGKIEWPAVIKSFQVSMACSYADTVHKLEKVCKKRMDTIYIVGGGSRNTRLSQLAADYTGKTVITGGKESTSIGNIAGQIRYFQPETSVAGLREIICGSVEMKQYNCRRKDRDTVERYRKLPG